MNRVLMFDAPLSWNTLVHCAATRFRWGGIFNDRFIANFLLRMRLWKNFEERPVFDGVMGVYFFWPTVYSCYIGPALVVPFQCSAQVSQTTVGEIAAVYSTAFTATCGKNGDGWFIRLLCRWTESENILTNDDIAAWETCSDYVSYIQLSDVRPSQTIHTWNTDNFEFIF